MKGKKKYRLKKSLKWLGGILLFFLLLPLILSLLLQIPYVQEQLRTRVNSWVQETTGTDAGIGEIGFSWPDNITLRDIHILDLQQDTLLRTQELGIDFYSPALLAKTINIPQISLNGSLIQISRTKQDTTFNYDFLINAFSSPPDSTSSNSKGGWDIKLGRLILNNLDLSFEDEKNLSKGGMKIGHLGVGASYNPQLEKLEINRPVIQNLNGYWFDKSPSSPISIDTSYTPNTDSGAASQLDLLVHSMKIENSRFHYQNASAGQDLKMNIGFFKLDQGSFQTAETKIGIRAPSLSRSNIEFLQRNIRSTKDTTSIPSSNSPFPLPFQVKIKNLQMKDNTFKYDDLSVPRSKGFSASHLALQQNRLVLPFLHLKEDSLKLHIKDGAFEENNSGIILTKLTSHGQISNQKASLKNTTIKTDQSTLKTNLTITNPFQFGTSDTTSQSIFSANLNGTSIAQQDLLTFLPSLRSSLKDTVNSFRIGGDFGGTMDSINLQELSLKTGKNTQFTLNGWLQQDPETDSLLFDMQLHDGKVLASDIGHIVKDSLLPASIRLPDTSDLELIARSTGNDMEAKGTLTSSSGSMHLEANSHNGNHKAKFKTQKLDLGHLLYQEENLSPVTLQVSAQGSGKDWESLRGKGNLKIAHVWVAGKDLQNGQFHFKKSKDSLGVKGELLHDVLDLALQYRTSTDSFYHHALRLQLNKGDLQALGLVENPFVSSGKLVANIRGNDLASLNGEANLTKFKVLQDSGRSIFLDTLSVNATSPNPDEKNISFQSPLFLVRSDSQPTLPPSKTVSVTG